MVHKLIEITISRDRRRFEVVIDDELKVSAKAERIRVKYETSVRDLSYWQLRIIRFMWATSPRGSFSPTQIGRSIGEVTSSGAERLSSWACPKLTVLCKRGLLERSTIGHYSLTPDGTQFCLDQIGYN